MSLHTCIILAGGKSSRMGKPKSIQKVFNKPWLYFLLDHLQHAGFKQCYLITGHYHASIQEVVTLYPHKEKVNIHIIKNEDWKLGPFSSLKKGIEEAFFLNHLKQGVWILPVDGYPPTLGLMFNVTKKLKNNYWAIQPSFQNKGAHPVWIHPILCQKILKMSLTDPQARLDLLIKKDIAKTKKLSTCNPWVLTNNNTPENMRIFEERYSHFYINLPKNWKQIKPDSLSIPQNRFSYILGKPHSGKTTTALALVKKLIQRGYKVGGFLQPVIFQNGERQGYDLLLLSQEKRIKLACRNFNKKGYYFSNNAWTIAEKTLIKDAWKSDFIFVDEIGLLEAQKQGHFSAIVTALHEKNDCRWIFVVREEILSLFINSLDETLDIPYKIGNNAFTF